MVDDLVAFHARTLQAQHARLFDLPIFLQNLVHIVWHLFLICMWAEFGFLD